MCSLKKSMHWSIHSSSVCCLAQSRLPMARPIRMILSLSLILILLFMWASCPMVTAKALLSELTLVGGGALTLAALLDLLMVTFGASGMDGAVRNQAAATGTQPVPYVGQLLNRYLGTVLDGIAPATWAQPIQEGLSYLANGTLYLSAAATAPIADFQRWAWEEEGANLESFAVLSESEGSALVADGYSILRPSFNISEGVYFRSSEKLFNLGLDYFPAVDVSGLSIYLSAQDSSSGGTLFYYYAPSGLTVRQAAILLYTTSGGYIGTAGTQSLVYDQWQLFYSLSGSANGSDFPINAYRDVSSIPPISQFLKPSQVVGDPDTFVGPMQQGQGTELPLADVVDVSSGTAARAHLFDYLHAGASAYAGTGVAELPVTDVGTGEDQVLPLNVPLDTPIGVTGVSDGTISGSGSLAGTDAIAGDFAGTDAYTMDLTQFFPFCIPFDLFALYQKFEAEAAAPVIDWPIPMPGGADPVNVHLDFSVFDQLAVWVRRMELIAFAVGLMILTKNLIQGGD